MHGRSPAAGAYSEGFVNSKLTQVSLKVLLGVVRAHIQSHIDYPLQSSSSGVSEGAHCAHYLLQNYEIECPDTKTKFSLKTGDITDWWAPPLPVELRVSTSNALPPRPCSASGNTTVRDSLLECMEKCGFA